MNAHCTFHFGWIVTRFGETPLGVNLHGLTVEDGPYEVVEALGCDAASDWEIGVIAAIKDGLEAGESHGIPWTLKIETQFPPVDNSALLAALRSLLSLAESRLPDKWKNGADEVDHPLAVARYLVTEGGN